MHAFSRNFPVDLVKGSFAVFIILAFFLFSLVDAQNEDTLNLSTPSEEAPAPNTETSTPSKEGSAPNIETSAPSEEASAPSRKTYNPSTFSIEGMVNPLIGLPPEPQYINYAIKGVYENETWFSDIPEWHYYDLFGNKIIDGYYLYGLTMNRNTQGTGLGNLILHPFLKKWLMGLAEVSDLRENSGILAMFGDRIKSEFTPFSLKQTLFAGTRFDVFYKQNSLTFLTNRISSTGMYGMLTDVDVGRTPTQSADWLTGVHGVRKFGEIVDIGGTYMNIHHEESKNWGNPFSGVDSDTLFKKTPTGLSLFGLDFKMKLNKIQANGEYLRSQEILDGDFQPKPGDVATLNGHYNFSEKWMAGGESYSIGSRFQTNFTCPAHEDGDFDLGKYQYSLVEDNDDNDDYPENGRSKYPYYTPTLQQGDPDGVLPAQYDKDKNGLFDYKEDFLNYDADPPESKILFDRNNNGTPDEIENDAYPDYPYVPGYYLPGERYWRYDDVYDKWENMTADSLTHKGLAGLHFYSRYKILPNLEATVGGIFDRSQEKTFQLTYDINGAVAGEVHDFENATSLYFLTHYKKDIAGDKYFTIDNFFRKVQDNIPNHTQGFSVNPDAGIISYYLIADELDYRDIFEDALRAEFTIIRNRGFNCTSVGKLEFQKHFPHLEFNYPDENISSLILLNKCHYIYLLPFLKDMFLIPKYKNYWEIKDYGPRSDSVDVTLDAKYRRNAMINAASVVCEWRVTEKIALTTGLQLKKFDDFIDNGENYWEPCFRVQLTVRDRYMYALALTTGFSRYSYLYSDKGRLHNPLNNPHGVVTNIDANEIFLKIHCGFL